MHRIEAPVPIVSTSRTMDITQNPSLWVRFNSIHVEREDINRVNTIETEINNLLEAIDETNVDQQMQTYFENPSLALDARSVREFLLLKLQKIEKRDQHFQNIYSAKKKEKTFFGIRSSLEFIHSGLVNMINTQKKENAFFLNLPTPFSLEHVRYSGNGVILGIRTNSHVHLSTIHRIMIFIVILTLLYEAYFVLNIDSFALRQIYYWIIALLNSDDIPNQYFIHQLADIFQMIELDPYSFLFDTINRQISDTLYGDCVIHTVDSTVPIFNFSEKPESINMFSLSKHTVKCG